VLLYPPLQPTHLLPRILLLREARISVLPEGEEFIILSLNFGRMRLDRIACQRERCPCFRFMQQSHHLTCFEKLKEFKRSGVVGQHICGVCVKFCRGISKDY